MKEKLWSYRPYLLFLLSFSAFFLVIKSFFLYLLPFVVAILFAVVMRSVFNFLRKKFRFQASFCATVISLMIFSAILALFGFVAYLIVNEMINFIETHYDILEQYAAQFNVPNKINEFLLSGDFMMVASDFAVGIVKVVPLALTFLIITFALSVFLLNHIGDVKRAVLSRLEQGKRLKAERIVRVCYQTTRKFLRSYLILYFITFVEAAFILILTKVPYPLVFALLCAVADLLPILGPGTVYVPLAVLRALKGDYLSGITLGVFFIITVIIRQITEPKLVSDTVKIHPIIVLSALYFSVASMNIWVLFYVLLLVMTYKILTEAEALEPLF